ncbi:glycosyltransferase family 4 protein [Bacteroidota bacterium]
MKILWIVNTVFPDLAQILNKEIPIGGGWMYGMAKKMASRPDIQLGIASVHEDDFLLEEKVNGVSYFLLPNKSKVRYDKKLEDYWESVCDRFNPDIIHIHGSEYAHGLACLVIRPNLNFVISIQGIIGPSSRYFLGGMSFTEIFKSLTFRDLVTLDTLLQQKFSFIKRSKYEVKYFTNIANVIGRTDWDFAHSKYVGSTINYHFCNETLRDGFYKAVKWDLNKVDRYSIFLSQANYPLKGAHNIIKAAAKLVTKYPSLKIKIGGHKINRCKSIKDKLKLKGYGKFLNQLIKLHDLENNVEFLGLLNESQMIAQYQKAHVFICPSSIENSPNSLGEAQIIGTPVIASFVGGVANMVEHNVTGLLYRFEEVEMLSNWVSSIFNNAKLAQTLSENSIKVAEKRHDRDENLSKMISIYNKIVD